MYSGHKRTIGATYYRIAGNVRSGQCAVRTHVQYRAMCIAGNPVPDNVHTKISVINGTREIILPLPHFLFCSTVFLLYSFSAVRFFQPYGLFCQRFSVAQFRIRFFPCPGLSVSGFPYPVLSVYQSFHIRILRFRIIRFRVSVLTSGKPPGLHPAIGTVNAFPGARLRAWVSVWVAAAPVSYPDTPARNWPLCAGTPAPSRRGAPSSTPSNGFPPRQPSVRAQPVPRSRATGLLHAALSGVPVSPFAPLA